VSSVLLFEALAELPGFNSNQQLSIAENMKRERAEGPF
jgi:hypothetical protein